MAISAEYQASVLSVLHLNHPGMARMMVMMSLARLHVWRSSLDHDEEQTAQDCYKCQRNRIKCLFYASKPLIWPNHTWQRIHLEFAGSFNGDMILVVVDEKSKLIEVFPMSSITSTATARTFRFSHT